jgi:predicted nuclease of predicted toxin-antitoxin system
MYAVDACIPFQLIAALKSHGANVISAAGRPAMPDEEVLSVAVAGDRVLITSDKDFGDLVFRGGHTALGIVLIRLDLVSTVVVDHTAQRIVSLENGGRGFFVVLERNSIRVRPMPTP